MVELIRSCQGVASDLAARPVTGRRPAGDRGCPAGDRALPGG
ncbi:hypothetical protein ACTXG6_03905 [Pseudonocardia sp. Cha107L01]